MTPEQATQLIDLVSSIDGKLDVLVFLGTGTVIGIGLLWGAITWHLIIVAKNQSTLF